MKYKFMIEKEFEVLILRASMNVRYWEDASVNGVECESSSDMPLSSSGVWNISVDIDNGRILDWPNGKTADVHFKVCDGGDYALIDDSGNVIIDYQCCVPNMLCPGGNGYGDYVIMKINETGMIENWRVDIDDFVERAR